MELLAPIGSTYQAGTLSGNPLAMAAGCVTLDLLQAPGAYARLDEASARLATGLADAAGDGHCVQRVGSMVTLFFRPGPVRSFAEAAESDTGRFAAFHAHCLQAGRVPAAVAVRGGVRLAGARRRRHRRGGRRGPVVLRGAR